MNRGKPFVSRLLEEREIERRRDIHKAKRDVRLQGVQRGESGWARGSLAGPRRPRTCRGAWPGMLPSCEGHHSATTGDSEAAPGCRGG